MMNVPSRSGFKAAIGSFADTFAAAGVMPLTYAGIFVITAVQTCLYMSIDKTAQLRGEFTTEIFLMHLVSAGTLLFMFPFGVALMRYFTGAAPYPQGFFLLCLRVLGWSILFGLVFFIAIVAVAVPIGILVALYPESETIGWISIAAFVIGYVLLLWAILRTTLFYPLVARGEPSPIFGGFRQMNGWAFFAFRTFFFVILLTAPIILALTVFQYALAGISFSDFQAGNIEAILAPQPFDKIALFSAVGGLLTTFGIAYYAAVLSRIFRTVRGIG
jgi:hypothetical protein